MAPNLTSCAGTDRRIHRVALVGIGALGHRRRSIDAVWAGNLDLPWIMSACVRALHLHAASPMHTLLYPHGCAAREQLGPSKGTRAIPGGGGLQCLVNPTLVTIP